MEPEIRARDGSMSKDEYSRFASCFSERAFRNSEGDGQVITTDSHFRVCGYGRAHTQINQVLNITIVFWLGNSVEVL